MRIADARGFERNDDLAIQAVLAEEAAFGGRENAGYREFRAIEKDACGPTPLPAGNKASPSAEPIMQTRWPRNSSSRVKKRPACRSRGEMSYKLREAPTTNMLSDS